ncbi:unnamed protein product [Victoria cruziana]
MHTVYIEDIFRCSSGMAKEKMARMIDRIPTAG